MKKLSVALLILITLALSACGVVYAADNASADPSSSAIMVAFLRDTVFPIVGTLFMALVARFLNRLGQKYHIESLTKQNNLIENLAFQGLTLAEETAAKYVGSKSELTGSAKLNIAVAHVLAVMPKVNEDQARRVVESLLGQTPGVGASGDDAIQRNPLIVDTTSGATTAPLPSV